MILKDELTARNDGWVGSEEPQEAQSRRLFHNVKGVTKKKFETSLKGLKVNFTTFDHELNWDPGLGIQVYA